MYLNLEGGGKTYFNLKGGFKNVTACDPTPLRHTLFLEYPSVEYGMSFLQGGPENGSSCVICVTTWLYFLGTPCLARPHGECDR